MNVPVETPMVQGIELSSLADTSVQGSRIATSAEVFRHVKTQLTVRVDTLELSIGDLMDAALGQTFQLSRLVDEPVDLLVGDAVVARGCLVAVDDCFGIQITELPSFAG